MEGTRRKLMQVDAAVAGGGWGRAKPWGGAGLAVVREVPPRAPGFLPDPRYVVTTFDRELSWLLVELWEVFRPELDPVTKFEFFGRLGNAARRYVDAAGGETEVRELLGAVVHESHAILAELESGHFTGPVVSVNNAIYDDEIPDDQREAHTSAAELESWLRPSAPGGEEI